MELLTSIFQNLECPVSVLLRMVQKNLAPVECLLGRYSCGGGGGGGWRERECARARERVCARKTEA